MDGNEIVGLIFFFIGKFLIVFYFILGIFKEFILYIDYRSSLVII